MSRDVVAMLSASLHANATVEVDTGRLLAGASARGQRLVRRRYAGFAAFACAVTTVAMLMPSVVSRGAPMVPGDALDATQAIAVMAPHLSVVREGHLPMLPKAPAEFGAAYVPEQVGKDPAVLHFGVSELAATARSVTWATGPSLEIMQIERAPDRYSWITLSSDSRVLESEIRQRTGAYADAGSDRDVDVRGRPGVLRTIPTEEGFSYLVRWEPVAGLVADVHVRAGVEQELWDLVDRVRLNEATRCVVPFGLSRLPSDFRLLGCRVSMRGYEDTTGRAVKYLRLIDAELSIGTAYDRARIGLFVDPKQIIIHPRAVATGGSDGGSALNGSPYPGETFALTGDAGSAGLDLYVDGGYKSIIGKLGPDAIIMGADLNNPDTWPKPVR
jgi:hypothetical protein